MPETLSRPKLISSDIPCPFAVLFKGQGTHQVGMADSLLTQSQAAQTVFRRAEDAVGFPLHRFMRDQESLDKHAQLATVVTEVALYEALKEQAGELSEHMVVAFGSSLGEYAALADRVVPLEDIAVLLHERSRLTEEAQRMRPGSMMAVVGLDEENLSEVAEMEDVSIGNHNFVDSHVLTGAIRDTGGMKETLMRRGAKIVSPLSRIPYASHSRLMEVVADEFNGIIRKVPFRERATHLVIPNVSEEAEPTMSGERLRESLMKHLTHPVFLEQAFQRLQASGIQVIVELGPGKPVFVQQFKRYFTDLKGLHGAGVADIKHVVEEMQKYAGTARS